MGWLVWWTLVSPDGVAPSRMVGVSASVNLPLHHKVQTFSSGTGSPGWFRKKGRKMDVVTYLETENDAVEQKRDAYDHHGKGSENHVYDSTELSRSNSRPSPCYGDAPHEMPSFHRGGRRDPFDIFREFFGDQNPFGKCRTGDFAELTSGWLTCRILGNKRKIRNVQYTVTYGLPSVLWCCWLRGRKGIRPVKPSLGVLVWLSVWSGCKGFAYDPADATATPSCLAAVNPEWFTFLMPAYPGCPGKKRPLNGYSSSSSKEYATGFCSDANFGCGLMFCIWNKSGI